MPWTPAHDFWSERTPDGPWGCLSLQHSRSATGEGPVTWVKEENSTCCCSRWAMASVTGP